MKIAITTASGQLSRAIINEVKSRYGNQSVIGLARTPEKAADLGVETRKGDYNLKSDFVKGLKGIDVVLLVSGLDAPDKRILQHRNVIEGAKEAGVRKIVYTSIYGVEGKCAFDSIIKSNRQTEKDIQESGLEWIIGRNGLYIEPDFDAIEKYKISGKIANSAGDGKCAYTSRAELARAYSELIANDSLNSHVYNLCGVSITQRELLKVINEAFGENLVYEPITVEEYTKNRVEAHGQYLGQIIAGIYEGIKEGVFDIKSDYEIVCGRKHKSIKQMAEEFKQAN